MYRHIPRHYGGWCVVGRKHFSSFLRLVPVQKHSDHSTLPLFECFFKRSMFLCIHMMHLQLEKKIKNIPKNLLTSFGKQNVDSTIINLLFNFSEMLKRKYTQKMKVSELSSKDFLGRSMICAQSF